MSSEPFTDSNTAAPQGASASRAPDSPSAESAAESLSGSDAGHAFTPEFHADSSADPNCESAESVESKLIRCQQIVEHTFNNPLLLHAALTHASCATHRLANNERLEFLGDSVLGIVVCEWLYQEYPEYSEGDLTKIKSSVVSRRSCGKAACELGLDTCLIVGKGVTKSRSFPRSLVSDVFESVVAAIYLDAGLDTIRARLRKWLAAEVAAAVEDQNSGNFKSTLQQYAQRECASTPIYRLVSESGPDHRKRFQVAAVINNQQYHPAWGNNKKDAEQHAAANALAMLHQEPPPFD
ncbi:MAG: ribonuclease III [Planctomycetaceae bacterium]